VLSQGVCVPGQCCSAVAKGRLGTTAHCPIEIRHVLRTLRNQINTSGLPKQRTDCNPACYTAVAHGRCMTLHEEASNADHPETLHLCGVMRGDGEIVAFPRTQNKSFS
jgi:hypothetical protein